MQNAGYAALQIIPSFEGFQGKLESGSSGALIAAGASGGRKYGDAAGRSLTSSFAAHAKRAALIGAGALSVAAAGLFKIGRDSLAEARESQKVGALTTQVIKSTGSAAGVTAKEVGDLSAALSLKTGVDDEVIQRGANMLLTFKDIRNEVGKNNDIFDQSVAITEDMAAAMAGGQGGGQLDLKSSSILVGKALNDPVKGLTALTRVGVSFTDQQKKNITSLVEQNKQTEAQKIILGELKSEFGGAAEAQATLGDKVSVAWGNIEEKLGYALLPLVRKVEGVILNRVVPALDRFADWFRKDGSDAIAHWVDQAKPFVHELLPAAADVLGTVRDVAHDAVPYVTGLVEAFNDMPDWVKKGTTLGGLGLFAGKKLGVGSLLGGGNGVGGVLGGIASKSAPLPVFVTNAGFGTGGPGGVPGVLGGPASEGPEGSKLGRLGSFSSKLAQFLPIVPALGSQTFDLKGKVISDKDFEKWAAEQEQYDHWYNKMIDDSARFNKGAKEMIAGATDLGRSVDGLPKQLVTKFLAPGLVQNRGDAMKLVRQYDLTPKEKRTLFQTAGIPQAKRETGGVLDLYRQANKTYTGQVSVNTGDTESRLSRILALMNTINHTRGLQASGALPGGSVGRASTGRAPRRVVERPAQVYVDGQQFTGRIRDEIDTDHDLSGERQRAGAPQ